MTIRRTNKLQDALVRILSPDGEHTIGTGFFCSPAGHILTCWHVLANIDPKTEKVKLDFAGKYLQTFLLDSISDKSADSVILKLRDLSEFAWLPVDIHNRTERGDSCVIYGFPRGDFEKAGIDIRATFGEKTKIGKTHVHRFEGIFEAVNDGLSGAPVWNERIEKVVGCFKADMHNLGFCTIPYTLLDQAGLLKIHDVYLSLSLVIAVDSEKALNECLKGTNYVPLAMEEGINPTKDQPLDYFDKGNNKFQHNRKWSSFDIAQYCRNPQGFRLLSSDVGTGKSTFTAWLAMELTKSNCFIPLLFHCRDVEKAFENDKDIQTKWIEMFTFRQACAEVDLSLKDLVWGLGHAKEVGKLVIICDGLDQIDHGNFSSVVKWLRNQSAVSVFVTSRPFAVLQWEKDYEVGFLRLRSMDENTQRTYFGEYYDQAMSVANYSPDLASVPMLSYMILTLIRNGQVESIEKRVDVYTRYLEYIFASHSTNKDAVYDKPAEAIRIRKCLEQLAYEALAHNPPYIKLVPLEICDEICSKHGQNADKLPHFGFVNYIVEGGTGPDHFLFTHQSFQEYLAACWARRKDKRIDYIIANQWKIGWNGVIRFLAGIEGKEFIHNLYPSREADNAIHEPLFLAATCCGEAKLKGSYIDFIQSQLISLIRKPFIKAALNALLNVEAVQTILTECKHSDPFTKEVALSSIIEHQVRLTDVQIQAVVDMLNDDDVDVRTSVLEALSKLSERITDVQIQAVADMLNDDKHGVRYYALDILHKFSDQLTETHIQVIVELLKDDFLNTIRLAADTLANASERLTDINMRAIIDILKHDQPLARSAAVYTLSKMPERLEYEQIQAVADRLNDVDADVRISTIYALCRMSERLSDNYIQAVIELLEDDGERVSFEAADNLVKISKRLTDTHIQAVVDMLRSNVQQARQFAAYVLCWLPKRQTNNHIQTVTELLKHDDAGIRSSALEALSYLSERLTDVQIQAVADRLNDVDADVRISTIYALCRMSKRLSDNYIQAVIELLNHVDADIRSSVLGALSELSESLTDVQIQAVVDKLNDDDVDVRTSVLEALSKLSERITDVQIQAVADMLNDVDTGIRSSALEALSELSERLTDIQIQAVADRLNDVDTGIRSSALEALSELPERLTDSHIQTVTELLKHDDAGIRSSALKALSYLSERLTDVQIQAVADRLNDVDADVRISTIYALCKMSKPLTDLQFQSVVDMFDSKNVNVLELAAEAIFIMSKRLADNHIQTILDLLKSNIQSISNVAIYVIGMLSERLTDTHIQSMVNMLKDVNSGIRNSALKALSKLPDRLTEVQIQAVAVLLEDNDSHVRHSALDTIYKLPTCHTQTHVHGLLELLNHFDDETKYKAYGCLLQIYKKCGPLPFKTMDQPEVSV